MKNKLVLIIFVIVYLISLVAGFGFAEIRQANAIAPTTTPTKQSSWILVRLDNLTVEQPRLISVWAMFLTYSPGPQVFFKPLFSIDAKTNKYPELEKVFSVSTDRTVSYDFIQELNKLIPHQSGLLILDNTGYETFTNWFLSSSPALELQPSDLGTSLVYSKKLNGETEDYNRICFALSNENHPALANLPWWELLPDHLVAHPTLQNLANLWEKLIHSGFKTHCEVIPIQ